MEAPISLALASNAPVPVPVALEELAAPPPRPPKKKSTAILLLDAPYRLPEASRGVLRLSYKQSNE